MSDADAADDPFVDVTLSRRQALGGVAGLAALGTGIGGLLVGGTRPAIVASGDWSAADVQVSGGDDVQTVLVGDGGTLELQWQDFEANRTLGVEFTLDARLAQQGTHAGSDQFETVAEAAYDLGHHAQFATGADGQGQTSFEFLAGPVGGNGTFAWSNGYGAFVEGIDVADGTVYVGLGSGSSDGTVSAYDPDADSVVWSHNEHGDLGSDIVNVTDVSVANGVVYSSAVHLDAVDFIVTASEVLAYDPEAGQVLWRHTEHGSLEIPAIHAADGVVYSGGQDGRVVAFDADTEQMRWSHDNHSSGVEAVYESEGIVYSGGGGDDQVVAFDAADETVRWTHGEHTSLVSDVHATNGVVYSAGFDDRVVAFDATDETVRWSHSEHSDLVNAVHAAHGVVYSAGRGGTLVAYDAVDETVNWTHSDHSGAIRTIQESGGVIYSGGIDEKAVAYDAGFQNQSDAFVAAAVAETGTSQVQNVDIVAAHPAIVADDFNPPDDADTAEETTVELRLRLVIRERPGDPDARSLDVAGTEVLASFTVTNQPSGSGTGADGTVSLTGTAGTGWN